MAADPSLIAQLSDVLQPLGRITARRMFSGAGIYADGVIISIVRGDGSVFFKVDDMTRPEFEAAGSAPFTYARKDGEKSLHSYWLLPADPFDDPDEVLRYGRMALGASLRAKAAEAAAPQRPRAPSKARGGRKR